MITAEYTHSIIKDEIRIINHETSEVYEFKKERLNTRMINNLVKCGNDKKELLNAIQNIHNK